VEFIRCPYDASPIRAVARSDDSALLSCATCGAAWEWHLTSLRRVQEPDRDAVRSVRAGREPVQAVRDVPEPAFIATMWRQVKATPPTS
jgi:hypothetical protein